MKALLGAAALAAFLVALPAEAHLMPPKQGTLNVVGNAVYAVFSIPISALHGADDDGDGVLTEAELGAHIADLRAEVDRGVTLLGRDERATAQRIDLVLSPRHEGAQDRADAIIVLEHATFAHAPRELELSFHLFGDGPEQEITVTATARHPSGDRIEAATFRPGEDTHRYFRAPADGSSAEAQVPVASRRSTTPWVLAALAGLGLLAFIGRRRRGAPHSSAAAAGGGGSLPASRS